MATDSMPETVTSTVRSCEIEAVADIQARVLAALRLAWVRPTPPQRVDKPRDRTAALAKATLDAMLVRSFRVTRFPSSDEYRELLARVTHWVGRGQPIHIMLGYAPMKNPKTVSQTQADWAEFFALAHLAAWHNKVCAVYPPGLRIKIIFDDSTIRMANRYSRTPMDEYIGSIGELIRAMNYESFIVGTMRQSAFAWLFHFGPYQVARWRVRRWERDPANKEVIARMIEFAQRNATAPVGMRGEEIDQYYRNAAHRYRVYWEALQLSGLSRLGHKIVAMYLDGHQHHLPQKTALHLTSVGKGQVTQPWQGVGALLDNGHGRLIPTVLTRTRQHRLIMQTINASNVFRRPGFEVILLCREKPPGSHFPDPT